MNPIPRNDSAQTGASFAPRCRETCSGCSGGQGGACTACRCTGEWGPANLEIVDHVALPWMLPAGDYVVGWRWDAEESNQVWSACSDVTIKPHPTRAPPQEVEFAPDAADAPAPTATDADADAAADAGAFGRVACPLPSGLCFADVEGRVDGARLRDVPLNKTLQYARDLLQQAVMVEHSTIPLYLTALFSIANGSEVAAATIHSVVIEEMLHMTIAANTLNAVGGAPMIDAPHFSHPARAELALFRCPPCLPGPAD